jgi:hypothetical protein
VGGEISADFDVSPGSVLYVEVGGAGTGGVVSGICTGGASAGGFNGGGAGNAVGGGGGGGASDVRTAPRVDSSSLGSRLIVAGGGGGAGANGGGGGAAGSPGVDGSGGGAGGPGTLSSGGAAGSPTCGTAPTAGGYGTGGAGDSQFPDDGGGGGGGGYWGGGGGGVMCGQTASGGGGGSSYVAPSALAATSPTTSASAPSVTITPLSATAQVTPGNLTFAKQAQSTVSQPQVVTVTNMGNGPLTVTGLSFTGADPGDFLVSSSTCGGSVQPSLSCQIAVNFAPQAQGVRGATLKIASNDANGPASVSLSGTGGSLPQGPPGKNGTPGKNGKIELVVCNKVTKTVVVKGHKVKKTRQRCSARLVSGKVKFVIDGDDLGASVAHAGVVYATGYAVPEGASRYQLVLHNLRPMRPGHYTLTLRHHHRVLRRTVISLR